MTAKGGGEWGGVGGRGRGEKMFRRERKPKGVPVAEGMEEGTQTGRTQYRRVRKGRAKRMLAIVKYYIQLDIPKKTSHSSLSVNSNQNWRGRNKNGEGGRGWWNI
jgi:hypothetical protein